MADYKLSLYMSGEFTKKQINSCFKTAPELLLEKGERNSGGKRVKTAICNIIIADGEGAHSIYPVLDEAYEKISELICGVIDLRDLTVFDAHLRLVIRTDPLHPMPAVGLEPPVIELLCKSEIGFDVDCYDYDILPRLEEGKRGKRVSPGVCGKVSAEDLTENKGRD